MCQKNTFMFANDELDSEKIIAITKTFSEFGFNDFVEYTNKYLKNIEKNLRLFDCGNICDCGSVITKKVVVDEKTEQMESALLTKIITKLLTIVSKVYVFSHWYRGNISKEMIRLERKPVVVSINSLNENTFRAMFYNQVLLVVN